VATALLVAWTTAVGLALRGKSWVLLVVVTLPIVDWRVHEKLRQAMIAPGCPAVWLCPASAPAEPHRSITNRPSAPHRHVNGLSWCELVPVGSAGKQVSGRGPDPGALSPLQGLVILG
jgi:hypothetical protein